MVPNISLVTHLHETKSRARTLIQVISWTLLNYEQGYILGAFTCLRTAK